MWLVFLALALPAAPLAEDAVEWSNQGLSAARERRFSDAARDFAKARSLDSALPGIDQNLGLALFDAGECEPAVEPLSRAKVQSPENTLVLLALGTCLARTHHPEEAQKAFEEFLRVQPETAEFHCFWGEAYMSLNRKDDAEKEFRLALAQDPKTASAHFYLGVLALGKRDFTAAEREFRGEVENQPADLSARYHLAFTLLKEQRAHAGVAMLEAILRENPKFTDAQYSLGQALIDSGKTTAAIQHLETAARLAPSKAYVHYQLGRAYVKAGRAEDGRREFQLWRELKDKSKGPATESETEATVH